MSIVISFHRYSEEYECFARVVLSSWPNSVHLC